MALFKILSNMNNPNSNLPKTYHQGYCYFDVNTQKFWIDTKNTADGRVAINAPHADKSDEATIAYAAIYAIDSTNELIDDNFPKIQDYYGHNLGVNNNNEIYLISGNGSNTQIHDTDKIKLGTHITVYHWTST